MLLTTVNCLGICKRAYHVISESFDNDGFRGIYYCPRCKDPKITVLLRPVEIDPPKITIRKEGKPATAVITLGKPKAAPMVEQPGQGEAVPGEQLSGAGLRDDKSGEGAPEKSKEQAPDGLLESGVKSPYEAEVSKYLGVKCDPKFIF